MRTGLKPLAPSRPISATVGRHVCAYSARLVSWLICLPLSALRGAGKNTSRAADSCAEADDTSKINAVCMLKSDSGNSFTALPQTPHVKQMPSPGGCSVGMDSAQDSILGAFSEMPLLRLWL